MRQIPSILWGNFIQALIWFDIGMNLLVCTLGLQEGFAAETLSAHCWRAYRDGKPWGRILMPPIDWMFSWQKADPQFRDEAGNVITGHCRRAFCKERERSYLPPEYRETQSTPK